MRRSFHEADPTIPFTAAYRRDDLLYRFIRLGRGGQLCRLPDGPVCKARPSLRHRSALVDGGRGPHRRNPAGGNPADVRRGLPGHGAVRAGGHLHIRRGLRLRQRPVGSRFKAGAGKSAGSWDDRILDQRHQLGHRQHPRPGPPKPGGQPGGVRDRRIPESREGQGRQGAHGEKAGREGDPRSGKRPFFGCLRLPADQRQEGRTGAVRPGIH